MPIGKYRHRVSIQTATPSLSGVGQETLSWATTSSVWAEIETAYRGEEGFRSTSKQRVSLKTFWVRLRYRTDLSVRTNRILFGSRVYNILSIEDEPGLKVETTLLVEETQA